MHADKPTELKSRIPSLKTVIAQLVKKTLLEMDNK